VTLAGPSRRTPRRTQEERSSTTRAALLDATIACLIDVGYARTTTTGVAERAGVSRGAQLHHFPTKAELVLAAVAHLARRSGEAMRSRAALLARREATGRIEPLLDLIWESFSGPLFAAALELWVAARTDAELHRRVYELERGVGRAMAELWEELGGAALASRPRFEQLLELTLHMVRGMAVQKILRPDDRERRRLFHAWKELVRQLVEQEHERGDERAD
jgi:AcrR family transcriptional regulator